MDDSIEIFDRRILRRHRDRAAAGFGDHDFLFMEVGERLLDRLDDVKRDFSSILELGCRTGGFSAALQRKYPEARLVSCDVSPAMAARARSDERPVLVADEEALPFAPASFDLVFSVLDLHWVNDLPGCLLQLRQAMRPDGLLLVAVCGGDTLFELRSSLVQAETMLENGLSPRISPMTELRDLGGLLQRSGFALPVADSDTLTVTYADPFRLMQDLRAMGESNAARHRRQTFTRRQTLAQAARLYFEQFATDDGRLPATFQVFYMTAWSPHESQPSPLRPGSAEHRLADALDSQEESTDDPVSSE
ncbi:methyltransferase domain-containing protein [Fodinicurvata halophila]|uniref:Malonyl-[acyl-carrier protein] O-methyltransferase n=1 Tax=Fodinicurvata halophila TaxID=1419723 RepID=A0ABV8UHN1_9PROT